MKGRGMGIKFLSISQDNNKGITKPAFYCWFYFLNST
jgi:hypothetical protein